MKQLNDKLFKKNTERLTHAYVHRLADVHLAGFAPAFPLSFHDRKYARKPPVPIALVVMRHPKRRHCKHQNDMEITIIKYKTDKPTTHIAHLVLSDTQANNAKPKELYLSNPQITRV